MDNDILWKCLIIFNFFFFLLWAISYTYHPSYLRNGDIEHSGSSNSYLRNSGRSLIFLSTLIASLLIVILVYILYTYYMERRVIECKRNAKKLSDCKFLKSN